MQRRPPTTHVCNRCGAEKPFNHEHFKPMAGRSFGSDKICRECRRSERADQALKDRTGLTREELRAELDKGCWVCGGVAVRRDADPETRESLGAVCTRCGPALAILGHDPDKLMRAAQGIADHRLKWLCG